MRQTIHLSAPPSVLSWANIGGKYEKDGPLAPYFDQLDPDSFFGETTYEKSGICHAALCSKQGAGKSASEQRTTRLYFRRRPAQSVHRSRFCHAGFSVPFYGLYGACSTMGESLSPGGAAFECGLSDPRRRSDLLPFLQRRTAVPHAHALWQPALSHRAVDRHRRRLHHPLPPRETGLISPM